MPLFDKLERGFLSFVEWDNEKLDYFFFFPHFRGQTNVCTAMTNSMLKLLTFYNCLLYFIFCHIIYSYERVVNILPKGMNIVSCIPEVTQKKTAKVGELKGEEFGVGYGDNVYVGGE